MSQLALTCTTQTFDATIALPTSKSESNRALIIQHLSQGKFQVNNTSSADDTQQLVKLLSQIGNHQELDCGPAGTTFRFLCSALAFTSGNFVLTGSERMQERPIKDLVDALLLLGANIQYLNKKGYPPLRIEGVTQTVTITSVSVENSSQYLSSLLLTGAFLPQGINIQTTGSLGSAPYVDMTIAMLQEAGIAVLKNESNYRILPQVCLNTAFSVEADWSGASYWFSRVALSSNGKILLLGLKKNSLQGDRVVTDIYSQLGVGFSFTEDGLQLFRTNTLTKQLTWDFTHCPDLAQTVIATCAVLGITGLFSGLKSLRIKETDRILAMQTELKKIGATLKSQNNEVFALTPSNTLPTTSIVINTYHDHRMAMAFAPIAAIIENISIENPAVVSKSYPRFWDDLKETGIK
jgi:3-phosphoshikimate 1-carboxyvinyltransferase